MSLHVEQSVLCISSFNTVLPHFYQDWAFIAVGFTAWSLQDEIPSFPRVPSILDGIHSR